MISLRQLRYSDAISRHLRFRKAAEECAVSQSALSTAISEMEKSLGFAVFERNNKSVLITPLGEEFLRKARDILLRVDDLMNIGSMMSEDLRFPMTIGVIPSICPFLLPQVLPALNRQYPDFELNVMEEQSHVLVEQVRDGRIDAAILALPYPIDGLLSFEFWSEDFFYVFDEKFADIEPLEVTTEQIKSYPLMLLKEGHCLKDHALSICDMQSDQVKGFGATSLSTLIQLAVGLQGATIVPAMALKALVTPQPSLQALRIAEPSPHRRLTLVVRPNYTRVNSIETLGQLFRQCLATGELEKSVA